MDNFKVYLNFLCIIIVIVFLITLFVPTANIFFHFKILRNYRKIRFESDYFRDILSYSPSEILYIWNKRYRNNVLDSNGMIRKYKKMFYINLLKMNLLGYVTIDFSKEDNFKITKNDVIILDDEYKMIYDYIFTSITCDSNIMLYDINNYVECNYNASFFKMWDKLVKKKLSMNRFYSKDFLTVYSDDIKKYYSIVIPLLIIIELYFLFTNPYFGKFLLISYPALALMSYFESKNIKIMSNRSIYEYKKIKALKKFLEDFSIVEERSIEYIKIMEDYVVYASIFDMYDLSITEVMKEIRIFLESD